MRSSDNPTGEKSDRPRPSPPHRLLNRQGRLPRVVFAAAVLLHLFLVIALFTSWPGNLFIEASRGFGQAADFFGIYQAGANLLEGYGIYETDSPENAPHRVVPFFYFYRYLPPTAYAAALGTLFFGPRAAYWVWVLFNEILIIFTVGCILSWKNRPSSRRFVCASLWMGYFPVCIEQFMGQFSLCMAVLLLWLWKLDSPEREETHPASSHPDRRPGLLARWRDYSWKGDRWGKPLPLIVWTASMLIKSFSILLALPFLRDRRLKRVLAGLSLVILLSLPYFIYRPRDLLLFARRNLSPFTTLYAGDFGFQALLRALIRYLPDGGAKALPALGGMDINLEKLLLSAVSVLIFTLAVRAALRWEGTPRRQALDLLLWTTVFFLIYKTIWEYHYVMILPAVTAAFLVTGSRLILVMAVLIGLPTLFVCFPLLGIENSTAPEAWPGLFKILHFSVKSLPVLVLYGWCIKKAPRKGHRGGPGPAL
ncbi:MAG: hypothetical protein JXB45_05510 [Candidatus Krumholzibacteriota bacterium]|nr:hypothetical protein [Candidatus Krumholzibacteriota bacterium]